MLKSIAAIGMLLFSRGSLHAQSPQQLWSIDLGQDKYFHQRIGTFEALINPPSISFLSDSQLICDFYDGARQGENVALPIAGYHVLEIDARRGKIGRELNFQPTYNFARTLPVDDGGFVVSTGNELLRFSNDFVPGVKHSESGWGTNDWLRVDESPSLQTILVYGKAPEDAHGGFTWLRAKDLSVITSVESPRLHWISASDSGAIFDSIANRELLSAARRDEVCKGCNAYFLSDDLIFVDNGTSYKIQTLDGVQRATGKLNVQALALARAAQVPRVVYVTGGYRGRGFPIQSHFDRLTGSLVVLDWNTNKRIAEIKVNEPVKDYSPGFTQSALALSPDGKYLAFLFGQSLTLYRLP
jgi:hypothetical protein